MILVTIICALMMHCCDAPFIGMAQMRQKERTRNEIAALLKTLVVLFNIAVICCTFTYNLLVIVIIHILLAQLLYIWICRDFKNVNYTFLCFRSGINSA